MRDKLICAGIAIILAIIGLLVFGMTATTTPDVVKLGVSDYIYEPSAESGYIAEKIIGDPDKAKLTIFEYADFGCSHCAEWNGKINDLLDKYGDDIALVFRAHDLGFQNGAMAARAATAAQIQGYFKEYKDLLFANQVEWFYAEGEELTKILSDYFVEVSGGLGDVDKFLSDMESESVGLRLAFEQLMGEKANLTGTPMFRIGGKTVKPSKLVETIERKLADK